MNRKRGLSEAGLGYIMVLPAMIIILTIALYPVLRTFWYSMFDLRLNNPVKSSTQLSYKFDLENYLGQQFYISNSMRQLESSSSPEVKQIAPEIRQKLADLNAQLLQMPDISSRYNNAKALVDKMKPVSDKNLRYAALNKANAEAFISSLDNIQSQLAKVSKKKGDSADQTAGLMEDLKLSVLKPNFIGLKNYIDLAGELKIANGETGRLGKSLVNTFGFTIISVFFELILGMIFALGINKPFRGRGLARAFMLVPWAIPTAVSAMMWNFLYDGQNGVISAMISALGLVQNPGIMLSSKTGAFVSVIMADVWKTTPYMALLLLAGLQTISADLYEASQIDGASTIKKFFRITLPLLKPTILVALLFRTLDAFRVFDLIFVLTGGGPANSTESISIYAYKTMFSQMDFGKGSTLSIVVFLCITLVSIVYISILGKDSLLSQEG
jgi:multiple sugar transport system permease protein